MKTEIDENTRNVSNVVISRHGPTVIETDRRPTGGTSLGAGVGTRRRTRVGPVGGRTVADANASRVSRVDLAWSVVVVDVFNPVGRGSMV